MENRQWAGTTFGSRKLLKSLIFVIRFTDVRILYLFSSLFVIPVCLITRRSRKTSFFYFRHILNYNWLKSAYLTYRNHCMFSQAVIDKFAMYAGKKFNVEIEGQEYYKGLGSRDEAFIQMSSHIGNYEIAGYTLGAENKTIHAIVYGHEKAFVMENRNKMFSGTNVKMIAIQEDMSHLFEINEAICKGDIISFPSDRFLGETKYITRNFLGREARFPQGPFSVATMRGLDVVAVNVMKTGLTRYKIYVTPLSYDKSLSRKEQIQQLSEAYVKELERMLKKYPEQWFNFYDFWDAQS